MIAERLRHQRPFQMLVERLQLLLKLRDQGSDGEHAIEGAHKLVGNLVGAWLRSRRHQYPPNGFGGRPGRSRFSSENKPNWRMNAAILFCAAPSAASKGCAAVCPVEPVTVSPSSLICARIAAAESADKQARSSNC